MKAYGFWVAAVLMTLTAGVATADQPVSSTPAITPSSETLKLRGMELTGKAGSPLAGTQVNCHGRLVQVNPRLSTQFFDQNSIIRYGWGHVLDVAVPYSSCARGSQVVFRGQSSEGLAFEFGSINNQTGEVVLYVSSMENRAANLGHQMRDFSRRNVFHCRSGRLSRFSIFGLNAPMMCTADAQAPDVSGTMDFGFVENSD